VTEYGNVNTLGVVQPLNSKKLHTSMTTIIPMQPAKSVLILLAAFAFSPSLSAQVAITYTNGGASVYEPYDGVVSATDAANQGISTFDTLTQTSGSALFGSQLSILNDGIVFNPVTYGTVDRGNTAFSFTPSDGSVIEFTFTSAQSVGSINTFAMSGPGQLRSAQNYGLEYLSGSNWTQLFNSLDTSAPGNINAGNTTTWVNLDFSEFEGGYLADVTALRFTFNNAGGDGQSLYREIDVNAIPEPSTLILLSVALGGIILFRRRCS